MIPSTLNQGDSYSWSETESLYPASDGWIINYSLVNATAIVSFSSAADVDAHDFTISTTITDTWKPGQYSYQRYVTDGTEKITLNRGTVEIKQNFITAGDRRSHAAKTLDAIQAVIEKRATVDQENYTINGRSLTRMNISDLLKFRDIYRAELAREKNAEKIANGLGTRQTIRTRF